ncbi:Protein CBR-NHR-243 [Caenorhabditis briggsae]|uniref:Protein CBR-NHR-243 n=1 Tax=Caenorhabditis briggsae TaxID=6238 RepID=A8WJ36_CAEBR|nr:Protein CBR-NHR-243 [Caenorhabditis briggsae]CAP20480.2 Protein CBR-NHR-243 [Caenorhabditis briggsae]
MLSLPSSSSSSSDSATSSPESPHCSSLKLCAVCDLPAKGKHFGAFSCRACAAFFRRTSTQPVQVLKCKKSNNCKLFNGNGWFQCKKCRLEKCFQVGMSMRNFQFDRDSIKVQFLNKNLPLTIEELVGRPHFVISCAPKLLKIKFDERIIECDGFVEKGKAILWEGSETPIFSTNSLQKMAIGRRKLQENHNLNLKMIRNFGESETMAFWESDFLRAAKWFTILMNFKNKLAITAMGRQKKLIGDFVMLSSGSQYSVMDMKNMELDLTWCARLSNQEMQFFYDTSENNITYKYAQEMMELNPDDVELSYMLADLALSHASRRFRGEIEEICEKLMEILGNALHNYYVEQKETPRYALRLAQILKINRKIKEEVIQIRSKLQLAKIFDVHTVEFSHMEYFEDL